MTAWERSTRLRRWMSGSCPIWTAIVMLEVWLVDVASDFDVRCFAVTVSVLREQGDDS